MLQPNSGCSNGMGEGKHTCYYFWASNLKHKPLLQCIFFKGKYYNFTLYSIRQSCIYQNSFRVLSKVFELSFKLWLQTSFGVPVGICKQVLHNLNVMDCYIWCIKWNTERFSQSYILDIFMIFIKYCPF